MASWRRREGGSAGARGRKSGTSQAGLIQAPQLPSFPSLTNHHCIISCWCAGEGRRRASDMGAWLAAAAPSGGDGAAEGQEGCMARATAPSSSLASFECICGEEGSRKEGWVREEGGCWVGLEWRRRQRRHGQPGLSWHDANGWCVPSLVHTVAVGLHGLS